MKKSFSFSGIISGYCHGYVTAESLEEAKKKLKNGDWDDVTDEEWDIDEITEVTEDKQDEY